MGVADGGVELPSAGAALTSPQLSDDGDPIRRSEGGRRADANTDRDEQALRLDRDAGDPPARFSPSGTMLVESAPEHIDDALSCNRFG